MATKYLIKVDIDLKEIIPSFIANRIKDQTSLKDLIKSKNFEEIKVIGHKMAGNGPSYGFDFLGEIGHNLEVASEQNDIEQINDYYQKFCEFMENYEIYYE